ncbi:BppU family phage baseplate upper protein [Clostridium perfringens]
MSEIGLNINVDSYNNEGIKTIKGNNNAEIYKLYILKNKRRLSLVGKTVKLGYVMVGTTNGDVIENLNITNAEQGEITFPITNRISKQDGVYSCQLAIYGADGFLEHTATFGLTVEANIFTKIAVEIADSKDFTYLENILDKASKLSEKLKENTSTATNANSNLESNITEANNINSKLLENTSTATSLNKNLESNIDLAKEVKETIKDLDTKNIEATEKIQTLTGLNSKATELSNNIQQGLPLNSELIKNTESAKTANNELIATNNDAKAKKTDLDNSLEEAKKYISGLDGSQNIPQIRMDVNELQNGLKSNQSLSYTGNSISANNTLEGRTEGMKIEGKTMYKKKDGTYTDTWEEGVTLESFGEKEGNKISILSSGKNFINLNGRKSQSTQITITDQKANEVTLESNSNNGYVFINLFDIKVSKNTNYVVGCKFENIIDGKYRALKIYGNSSKILLKEITNNDYSVINTGDNEKLQVYLYTNRGSNITGNDTHQKIRFYDIMIAEGSDVNSYTPYQEDKKDILIKEPLRENDIMYEDNGQVKVYRDVKQYTFTGDEKWRVMSQPQNNYIYFEVDFNSKNSDEINIICNNFIPRRFSELYKQDIDGISAWSNETRSTIFVGIEKSKLTTPDVNGFKAWLKANPTTIVYQLAEPLVEVVENCVDIDLDTFGEKTYFSIENSLPGTLDFKVPSNIASIVQSNSKAINELYNLIDTLVLPNILQNTTDIEMLKLEKLK